MHTVSLLKGQRALSLTPNVLPGEVPEPSYKDDTMQWKKGRTAWGNWGHGVTQRLGERLND